MKTVTAKEACGMNMSLLQLFGLGPLWTITCGHCSGTFKKRLPMVNSPGVLCPYCHSINVLEGIIVTKTGEKR